MVRGVAVRVELRGLGSEHETSGVVGLGDLAHEPLDVEVLVQLLLGHEGDGPAELARAARATDAVDVVVRLRRDVEVNHITDARDVDAAREHVGRHEDVGVARAEVAEGALALVLAAVAVDRRGGDPRLPQAPADRVRAVLTAGEHDDAGRAFFFEEIGQQRVFRLRRDGQDVLLDRVRGARHRGDLHARRIVDQVGDLAHRLVIERRGEQQRLARRRGLANDTSHRRQKPHVEHAVRLVEHEDADLVEVAGTLLDEVDQAPRRGDENVAAMLEGRDLRLVADAADNGQRDVARDVRDLRGDLVDLLGELARRGDDEHGGAVAVALAPAGAARARAPRHGLGRRDVLQAIHRGQQEGSGLSGAGLGRGEKVAAGEHLGDGAGLHRGGRIVSEDADGLEHLGGEPQLIEAQADLVRAFGILGVIGVLGAPCAGFEMLHMVVPYLRACLARESCGARSPVSVRAVARAT